MSKTTLFWGLLSLVLPLAAAGAVGIQSASQVQSYFHDLTSLRADFVQTVFDAQSRPVQTSSGRMYMQKPGRFRWDYRQPYAQVIVADGERLWLYDSELEQVSVRRMDAALGATPLALLSGAAPIEEAFRVDSGVTEGDVHWYELRPKDPQAEFKRLRVAFKGEALIGIELEDVFNQRTRLSFRDLERNVDLDPKLFQFTPPPGVDVVGEVK